MKLRELARDEHTLVRRAFSRWGVYEYFEDKSIMIATTEASSSGPNKICLVSGALKHAISKIEPEYGGLVIAELQKKGGMTPTIAGADIFARHAKQNQYYVTLNDAASQLVLYGRDVMGDSITIASGQLDENQLVIMLNEAQEAIGIGRTRFAGKSLLQKGRITITTIADAGHYLRDEG